MTSNSFSKELELLLRHRHKLMVSLLLIFCIATVAKALLPQDSLASRIIQFDDSLSRVNILAEKTLVTTDEVVGRVIKETQFQEKFKNQVRKEEVFEKYRQKLEVFHYPNTNVLKLTASDQSADMANKIITTHINEYLELSLERKQKLDKLKIELIESELKEALQKLDIEKKLLIDFATQNQVSLDLHLDENNLYEVTSADTKNQNLDNPNLEIKLDLLKRNYKVYRGIVIGLKSRLETQKIENALAPPVAEFLQADAPTRLEPPWLLNTIILISILGIACSLLLELYTFLYRKPK